MKIGQIMVPAPFRQIGRCMGGRWFTSQRQAPSFYRWRQLPQGELGDEAEGRPDYSPCTSNARS